jgi:hypothetical protein
MTTAFSAPLLTSLGAAKCPALKSRFMLGTTTPAEISESVLKFCSEIDSTQKPAFLRPQPHRKAMPNECFSNVREQINAKGGSMQLGWLVWETPRIMLEAAFHAVWRSPETTLIDVTPQPDREPEILFLPDSKATIDSNKPHGEVVGMRRFPLVDDPIVHEFIRLAEQKDAILIRTQGKLTRHDLTGIAEIERQQIPLHKKLALKYRGEALGFAPRVFRPSASGAPPLNFTSTIRREAVKVGRNDSCPCGSGRKYKKCHGK